MVELTYLVLVAAITVSLTTVTWSGFAHRFLIILAAVLGHAFFMYHWSWTSEMTAESWFTLYFLTMIPLVVGLVLCLSRGSRSQAVFLALAYCSYLAALMAICSMLLCRKNLALSMDGRLLAIWLVVVAFNFAFVCLVSRRAALCRRQSSWGLPLLAVGLLFALLVASGLWPVSLVSASRAELAVFALAAIATCVTIPALCHPSDDHARVAEAEDEKKEKRGEGEGEEKRLEVKRLGGGGGGGGGGGEGEQGSLTTGSAEPLTDEQPVVARREDTSPAQPTVEPATGEALFERARAMVHQLIPDFDQDGLYLELLGQSAAAGYAPALAKLGEYAMRRGAWVEAYYWMTQAKLKGLKNVDASLREIRREWSMEGFPTESENVNALFTLEAGSIGRALLHLDSGHDAAAAREFLKEYHPEFLVERTNLK